MRQVGGKGWNAGGRIGGGAVKAIAKKFAELLGGSIHAQSEVDKGSIFVVSIPMVYKETG